MGKPLDGVILSVSTNMPDCIGMKPGATPEGQGETIQVSKKLQIANIPYQEILIKGSAGPTTYGESKSAPTLGGVHVNGKENIALFLQNGGVLAKKGALSHVVLMNDKGGHIARDTETTREILAALGIKHTVQPGCLTDYLRIEDPTSLKACKLSGAKVPTKPVLKDKAEFTAPAA